ncbi:PIR protein [Plasmodium yoelii]|uniref:PIR protein n=2 Tax=Plasmodium yoelii TaxID=5861 RepID=A0AAE9WS47_PLAYO|nr:PIR protein [Plasmodium yoelii]WBY59006.1 PIR protein [Plasmodium yoelii yoelii]CDU19198.1 YIR protein [Plasmodium yoelii]VTZ79833.1 PIR protein [Plasmodium yoelii]|eukprot:XP_022812550.1 PIR protein [Plasmodium yoelii]
MDDSICSKFYILRKYLPDELDEEAEFDLEQISDFQNYCPNKDCKSELEKITIGFLWLLGQCYSAIQNKKHNKNNTNTFILYMISWFSYKLKQNSDHQSTQINDFYTKHVINNHKYKKFIKEAYTIANLKEFMNEQNDLLNINIEDLSKFYGAFKLLCSMYDNVETNNYGTTLSNNVNDFIKKYKELNNDYNNEGSPHRQILSTLSTDYNNLKNKCKGCTSLPDITDVSALASVDTSSSSIGNKLFTVLSIFGAIAFFLGISYKYSLFGFRKRFQKQYIREKIKNIKKKMNH